MPRLLAANGVAQMIVAQSAICLRVLVAGHPWGQRHCQVQRQVRTSAILSGVLSAALVFASCAFCSCISPSSRTFRRVRLGGHDIVTRLGPHARDLRHSARCVAAPWRPDIHFETISALGRGSTLRMALRRHPVFDEIRGAISADGESEGCLRRALQLGRPLVLSICARSVALGLPQAVREAPRSQERLMHDADSAPELREWVRRRALCVCFQRVLKASEL